MLNAKIIVTTAALLSLSACGDKAADEAAKAKQHFLSEQQKVLEQAKEVRELATEAAEKQKKALEELNGK
jgi:hypothetical protein